MHTGLSFAHGPESVLQIHRDLIGVQFEVLELNVTLALELALQGRNGSDQILDQ